MYAGDLSEGLSKYEHKGKVGLPEVNLRLTIILIRMSLDSLSPVKSIHTNSKTHFF